MGLLKKIFLTGLSIMALYGIYSCNRDLAEKRHKQLEGSALELKIEKEHEYHNKVVENNFVYMNSLKNYNMIKEN